MEKTQTPFYGLHRKWQQEREDRHKRSMAIKSKLAQEGPEIFRKFKLKKVILYGSVLENTMNKSSDIDIMVDYLPPEKFFTFQCQLEEKLNILVDLHTMDEDEQFTRKVLQRGEVIYAV